jgi:hypothetical protein
MRRKTEGGGTWRDALIVATRWAGRLACVAGFAAWSLWLVWRITSSALGPVSVIVLILEVTSLLVSLVLAAALWSLPLGAAPRNACPALPDLVAELLRLDDLGPVAAHGADDSGEVARARRGLHLLNPRAVDGRCSLSTIAWALVAVEGIRRMLFAAVLVAVLLTGRFPFEVPALSTLAALIGAQLLFAVGHWMLSGGAIRPGVRLRWSMASVGAGLGDGVSRTGLPIRWTATMATMIVLNLAVALRGFSDRWTHGLGAMPRDERVVAMVASWWLVMVGFVALHTMVKPSLGFYGATRRLEETSTRRLALGTTLAVAMVGFVAGLLPGGLPA